MDGSSSTNKIKSILEKQQNSKATMTDFIDLFLLHTEGNTSPALFRLWSAISLVGGALERRVWIKNGARIAYPNLFVLLVAPPGVGKFIIEEVRDLWSETTQPSSLIPAFHVAPDSMTKASLIDALAKAKRTFLGTKGVPFTYHSLLVAAEEFSVLLPAYDMEYIGVLNSIWSNKHKHEETRRHGPNKETTIDNPTLNLIGGAQPAWLSALFPEEAWSTGLARRLVMIYSTETPHRSLFYDPGTDADLRQKVLDILGEMSDLWGAMKWEQSAMDEIDKWYMSGPPNMGGNPVPEHTKLQHYNRSRGLFVLKLCIIASVARSREMIIKSCDVDRAIGWLLEAERTMPDIFRAMLGKSDRDVLDELHTYVYAKWGMTGRTKVKGEDMRRFLLERVPHEKVESLIAAAERANLIARVGGTLDDWVPKARFGTGVE